MASNLDQSQIGSKMMDPKTGKSIYLVATQEELTKTMTIAADPIEQGQNISDHVSIDEDQGTFTGHLLGGSKSGPDGQRYMAQLYAWQNDATMIRWYGRRYLPRVLISELSFSFDENKNAMGVTLKWQQIKITDRPTQKTIAVKKPAQKPRPKKNPGVYITVRWGMTYWGWWMKYGTPINTLRRWNRWPDRFIPTGARARVK